MKKCIVLGFIVSLLWFNALAWCDEIAFVGIVKNVAPEALIIRNDLSENAVIGNKIVVGDLLKTGSDGSMGVILKDDTVISMGPNTEILIQTFLFEPAKGDLSFIARMAKGTISYISGQITKLAPDSVHLETPVATIGPRGTHFLVQIEKGKTGLISGE